MRLDKFCIHVKKWRLENGLSQRSLAAKAGISSSYISKIENGKFDIGLHVIYRLSLGLGVQSKTMLDY